MDSTNSEEIIKKMKADAKLHENDAELKIREGNEKFKNTLNKIKLDMEQLSNKDSYKMSDRAPSERSNVYTNGNGSSNPNVIGKNNLPSSNKNDMQNDSALSSFHNHNINNRLKDNIKLNKNYKKENKSVSTKYDNNTISSDNMNSKENFFTKADKNLKNITKLNNSIEKNGHLDSDYAQYGSNYKNYVNYENNINIYKGNIASNDYKEVDIENCNNSNNYSPGKKSETNFKFTGPNFHSKGSASLNEEENSNHEYSNIDLDKKILEQRNLANNDDKDENDLDIENMHQFSQSGTFKSRTNPENYPNFRNDESSSYNYKNKFHNNNSDILNSQQNTNKNFNPQHKRNDSESISEDINSIRFNYNNFRPDTTGGGDSSKRGWSNNFNNSNLNNLNSNGNYQDSNAPNFNQKYLYQSRDYKKNLQEYLGDLENKNLLKLDKSKNQWILKFNEDDPEGLKDMENTQTMRIPTGENTKISVNSCRSKLSCSKIDKPLNKHERQNYVQLKNQIEILKREKESLEKIIKKNVNKSKNSFNTMASNYKSYEKRDKKTRLSSSTVNRTRINSSKEIAMNSDELREYESEVLDKLKNDDLFGELSFKKEDVFGSLIDRVIDGSLYLYKNRNCHTCSRLLSMGKSTYNCPKKHHLL